MTKAYSLLLGLLCITFFSAWAGINEWTYVGLAPERISEVQVDPDNSDIIYATGLQIGWDPTREGGVFKTTDHGATWDTVGLRHLGALDLTIDRLQPATIWVASGSSGMFRSTDTGQSWESRSNGLYLEWNDGYGPYCVAVSPHSSDYLMAGGASSVGDGRMYYTTDSGMEWHHSTVAEGVAMTTLAFDEFAPGTGYVGSSMIGGLWSTNDTGQTFGVSIDYAGTIYDLETVAPAGHAWAAVHDSVIATDDTGHTWTRQFLQLEGLGVNAFDLAPIGNGDTMALVTNLDPLLTLNAGTSFITLQADTNDGGHTDDIWIVNPDPLEMWAFRRGGGLWTYTYTDSLSSADPSSHDTFRFPVVISAYPNPTSGNVRISLSNWQGTQTKIGTFDVLGRLIHEQVIPSSGELIIRLPDGLPAGAYFVNIIGLRSSENVPQKALRINLVR